MLTLSQVCKYLKMELNITESLFQVPNKSLIGFSLSRIVHLSDARPYDFAKLVPHFFVFWWFGTRCAFKLAYLRNKTFTRSDFLQELPSTQARVMFRHKEPVAEASISKVLDIVDFCVNLLFAHHNRIF